MRINDLLNSVLTDLVGCVKLRNPMRAWGRCVIASRGQKKEA